MKLRFPSLVTGTLLTAVLCSTASADTLYIGESGKNPIAAPGVKVIDIQGGDLQYRTPGGTQLSKPLSQMQQIAIDGETSFNAAEEAFNKADWAAAITGYQSAMDAGSKQWIKDRSAMRLAQAGGKANRFDAAAAGYATLLVHNPEQAATVKPDMPADGSPQLKPAADAITKALSSASLSDAQRGSLLGMQLQIQRAGHNVSGVNSTLQQMMSLGSIDPADLAVVKLASARMAMDTKDFAKAESDVEQNRGIFTEPAQQIDALYLLAQVHEAKLSSASDANATKDVAIDFMKVVTFGKDLPGQPHVADSLLHTAVLEERLKEPKVALQLYQQVVKEYAAAPAATDAKAAVDRLSKGA